MNILKKLQKYLEDILALITKSLSENSYKLHNLEDFYQEVKLELKKIENIIIKIYDYTTYMFDIKDKDSATKFIQNYEALTKMLNKKISWKGFIVYIKDIYKVN